MHKHQNDKNEMTISLNITYLYSFPFGKWIVYFFSCTCMNDDEQKHNNVKFQIEFPIFFFLFFLFFCYFTPTLLHPLFLSQHLFFSAEGKTARKSGLRLYTEPVANKKAIIIKC